MFPCGGGHHYYVAVSYTHLDVYKRQQEEYEAAKRELLEKEAACS